MSSEKRFSNVLSVGKDTLIYIPTRLSPVLFGFLALFIYTRIFAPDIYGNYSLFEATIGFLGIFTYGWINESNLRFFALYKLNNRIEAFLSTSFFVLIAAVVVIAAALLALSWFSFLPRVLIEYFAIVVAILVVNSLFETLLTVLRSDRKPKDVSLYRTLSSGLCLGVSLVFIFLFGWDLLAILLGILLTNLALSLIIVLKFRFASYIHARHFSTDTLKEFMQYGLPLMTTLLFSWIMWVSNRYVIDYFKGPYEVGIYTTAFQLASYPISMVASMIALAAYPIIVDVWEKKGEEATNHLISDLTRYYLLFAIPAFVGIVVLSENMMVIAGKSYMIGYTVLPWICFGQLLFGLCFYTTKGLQLRKKTVVLAVLIGVAGMANLGLNILLVPAYGFLGSAVAMTLSYLLYAIFASWISGSYLKWSLPLGSVRNVVACSAIMGGALWLLRAQLSVSLAALFILVIIGAIVYTVAITLSGEVKSEFGLIRKYYRSLASGSI